MFLDMCSSVELTSIRPEVFLKGHLPLQQSSVMMLYANGGVGKSFLSIRMAYEFVLENKRRKVALWLTEDSPAENKRRAGSICRDMGLSEGDYADRIAFINSPPVRFTKMVGNNAELTRDFYRVREDLNEYSLVVLDPLLQFQGCDENSNTHAGILMGALKEWAAEEMKVILLLHHATPTEGKLPSGLPRLKPRGAGEWTNGTRGVYQLNKVYSDTIPTEEERRKLRATLVKDNGISFYVRDDEGNLHRDLIVFPAQFEKEDKTPQVPFISMANHNDAKNPRGFERVEFYFKDLHNMVIGGQAYSQFAFKGGYRKGENNEGGATVVCLDIDSGMTIEAARKLFARYEALIVTTKSHRKVKGDEPACDRYRVFLHLKKPLDIPVNEYPAFFDHLYREIKHVDPSTKDLARFYFSSPIDASYYYTESSTKFDWVPVYEAMKRSRALLRVRKQVEDEEGSRSSSVRKEGQGEPRNTLPVSATFETKAGSVTFEHLRNTLSVGEKVVCRCVDNIDHGGMGAGHYSAFVQKADNGNVFYSCSGGRCQGVGTLWCAGWR